MNHIVFQSSVYHWQSGKNRYDISSEFIKDVKTVANSLKLEICSQEVERPNNTENKLSANNQYISEQGSFKSQAEKSIVSSICILSWIACSSDKLSSQLDYTVFLVKAPAELVREKD